MENPFNKVADACRRQLQTQLINREAPGPILRDFDLMLDAIGTEGIATKSKRGNLPTNLLADLNQRISHPLDLQLTRPLLRDYPNLSGLYILLRVTGLVEATGNRVAVDPGRLAAWRALNPVEQYFALLEAWLLDAEEAVLGGEERARSEHSLEIAVWFLGSLKRGQWKSFPEWVHVRSSWRDQVSTWSAQLMQQFGLIEVKERPPEKRSPGCSSRGWMLEKARITPWGSAVAWTVWEQALEDQKAEEEAEAREEEEEDSSCIREREERVHGYLQPRLQPFFPDYRLTFAPPAPEVRRGVYVFKVGLAPRWGGSAAWRRLALPDDCSLDLMADVILAAFEFTDTDHLHEFRYRDERGRQRSYLHPFSDEGPWSSEVCLGETGLPVGGVMEFRFDFGDNWRFPVRLERIDPPDKKLKRPKVIESEGKPPRQYPGW